jgi:outer membrane protein OmpA-like peptidoglycan-associated protein
LLSPGLKINEVKCFVLAAAVLLGPSLGHAQDDPELLGISLRNKVQIGGQAPAVVVTPAVSVKRLSIQLSPQSKGRSIRLKSGAIQRGQSKALTWKQGVGKQAWNATFDVHYGHGKRGKFTIQFETTVYPKIASRISKENVNLEERYLTITLNQPAAKVDIQIMGDNTETIYEGSMDFDNTEAGTPLRVPWEQPEGVGVLKIDLKVWSEFGFWVGTEITPFEVQIPHEEVVFAFGKWDIQPSEEHKLVDTLELLRTKLKRFGGLVKLQLYIAGYTDTVGSRGSNHELSEKRARSIATWFKRRAIPVPILYQGFGEDALAVSTPNETKESRNRRALYVLSANAPATQKAIPRKNWKKL